MSKIHDNTEMKNTEEINLDAEAKAIAGLLDNQANRLSMRTLTQLETARETAVNAHKAKATGHQVNKDGTLSGFSWLRQPRILGATALCAALVMSVVLTQNVNTSNEQGDAFILGAELPPEAFIDRGFEPWLNAKVEF